MTTLTVRLERFKVSGFRSCRDVTFSPKRELSILIGVNGSGKSNLMQALLLLKKVSRASWRSERDSLPATSQILADYRVGKQRVSYQALIAYSLDERGNEEISRSDESWSFPGTKGMTESIRVPSAFLDDLAYVAPHREIRARTRLGKWIYLQSPSTRVPLTRKSIELIQKVVAFNRQITYYSASQFTDPSRCPNYFEIENDGSLRTSYTGATRHRQFLYDLYKAYKAKESSEYEEFLAVVGEQGIGLINKFSWREVKVLAREVAVRAGGKVVRKKKEGLLVIPTIFARRMRLGPSQLSEGTFKSLALLYYLLSDRSPLMLLEEPEVCVHHGLLTSILEVIKSCSGRKQIVCSTHSEFVLDAISPEQVYLVRYLLSKGTQVRELSQSMSTKNYKALKDYLNTSGNLGEYIRHGGIIV